LKTPSKFWIFKEMLERILLGSNKVVSYITDKKNCVWIIYFRKDYLPQLK
jgi:hypothetical protein